MNKILLLILGFISLFKTQANLTVYNAQSLGLDLEYIGLKNVDFSIANFGFVPFGKTMIGQLVISPNFSDECNFVENPSTNGEGMKFNKKENFFMIVPRGNCKFVPKALNAQKAGAKLVIIMDNQTYSEPFIMADNGEGYKVKIPAVFVNHADGQKLVKAIDWTMERGEKLILKVNFQNQKTEKVELKLYLQANNRRSYKLISDFQQFYEKISSFVKLNLIYHSEYCSFCLKQDCYFGEQYCSYQYQKQQGASGKDILDQQIRQMIVQQLYPQKWWGWMAYIGDQCTAISQLKQCSEQGMVKVGINPQQIQKAFDDSFTRDGNNKYLQKSSEGLMNSGVNKYPAVSINGYTMRGTISVISFLCKAEYLFDDICNTLSNPPSECDKYINETVVVTYVREYWLLLFVVIVVGFIIFSGLFILYKRYMKRKMSYDMKNRVDDMVSKYIEFYSERAGKN